MKPKTTTMKEKIAGINEIEHIFFEKANNINKCLARLSKKKKNEHRNYQYQKWKKKYH